jgi:predicted TPR repeat methyltransferase
VTAPAERLGRDYFDELYARDSDPWEFETSDYEREKYAQTLAMLGDRRFARALEVGCSIGVFTAQLAPRCDELLAVDVAEAPLRAARERTAGMPGVRVERASLPEDAPDGPFDLVVCSEVLYYLSAPLLGRTLDALTGRMAVGALLLAVHWTEPTRTYPLAGAEVHRLLRAHPLLELRRGESHRHYRIDLLERG